MKYKTIIELNDDYTVILALLKRWQRSVLETDYVLFVAAFKDIIYAPDSRKIFAGLIHKRHNVLIRSA